MRNKGVQIQYHLFEQSPVGIGPDAPVHGGLIKNIYRAADLRFVKPSFFNSSQIPSLSKNKYTEACLFCLSLIISVS